MTVSVGLRGDDGDGDKIVVCHDDFLDDTSGACASIVVVIGLVIGNGWMGVWGELSFGEVESVFEVEDIPSDG